MLFKDYEKTLLREVYNEISDQFSASRNYIWPDLKPFLVPVKTKSSVLDVGCGNGRLLLGLPEKTKYTGLDFSAKLLEKASLAHPNAHFIETDITKPDIWKHLGSYDYIYSIAVIHHLKTRREQLFVLKEIKKHLKPDGKFLITAWNLWQPKLLKHHLDLKVKLQNHHYVYIPFQGKPRFHFAHTAIYLKNLLREAGLKAKVVKTRRNYLIHNFG